MNDSDDYIPNAEDNLSILSDADKSSGQSDVDLEEINDVLLQNLESEILTTHNEVKQKDDEMHHFLEDLRRRFYAEKDAEYAPVIRKYERKLQELQEKNHELDECLKDEKTRSVKYLSTIDTLETECERLRAETQRQQNEIFALNDKIHKMNIAMQNRSTANTSVFMQQCPPSPIGNQVKERNFIADRTKLVLDTCEDCSDLDFNTTGFLKLDTTNIDEVWAGKLELYKEKLSNEEKRNKELDYMVATQKSLLESTNENIAKLKQDIKILEAKNDKLCSELDRAEQSKKVETTKIASVISFCELMDNCVFPKAELLEKLSELPSMIAAYLKGLTDTLSFNKTTENSNSKLLIAAKKVKATLAHLDENLEKSDRNYRAAYAANELDEIRDGISNLTQFLSKALPNQNQSVTSPIAYNDNPNDNLTKLDRFKFNSKLDSQFPDPTRSNHFKTSYFYANALPNTLLWGLNQQTRAAPRGNSEGHN